MSRARDTLHVDSNFNNQEDNQKCWEKGRDRVTRPNRFQKCWHLPCTHRRTCRSRSCGSARTRPPGCGARFRNSVNCSWTRGPFCQHFFPTLRRLLRASRPPVGAAAAFSGGCPAGVNRVWTTQAGELRNSRRTRFALDHFTFPVVPSPEISTK